MEKALKYAQKNGWEIQNTVGGGKIVFIPWSEGKKMFDYLKRQHIRAEYRTAGFYEYHAYIFNPVA
jgi:hypothetical protein